MKFSFKRNNSFHPRLAYTLDHRSAFIMLFSSVPLLGLMVYTRYYAWSSLHISMIFSVGIALNIILYSDYAEFNKYPLLIGTVLAIAAIAEGEGAHTWLGLYQLLVYLYFIIENGLALRAFMTYRIPQVLLVLAVGAFGIAVAEATNLIPTKEVEDKYLNEILDRFDRRLDPYYDTIDTVLVHQYSDSTLRFTADTELYFSRLDTAVKNAAATTLFLKQTAAMADTTLMQIRHTEASEETKTKAIRSLQLFCDLLRYQTLYEEAIDSLQHNYRLWKAQSKPRKDEYWSSAVAFTQKADSLAHRISKLQDAADSLSRDDEE